MPVSRISAMIASAALVLAVAVPVRAQGNSAGKGNGNGNGNANGHKITPPSSSPLPNPVAGPAAATAGAPPLAWLDDASLLDPGSVSTTISVVRWSGTDLSEVNFPIFQAAVGLTPRVQIGASVPHIVGSADGTGAVGGVGTSYVSAKIAVLTGGSGVKLAVSPLVEVLSASAAQALAPDEGRTQFGVPVSVEVGSGPARVFASAGLFSRGVWFAGGGVSLQATPKVGASVSFTRSWSGDGATSVSRDRQELSGGVSYLVRPEIAVYGALSQTIATADEDGAGTTVSGGVSILFNARLKK